MSPHFILSCAFVFTFSSLHLGLFTPTGNNPATPAQHIFLGSGPALSKLPLTLLYVHRFPWNTEVAKNMSVNTFPRRLELQCTLSGCERNLESSL